MADQDRDLLRGNGGCRGDLCVVDHAHPAPLVLGGPVRAEQRVRDNAEVAQRAAHELYPGSVLEQRTKT